MNLENGQASGKDDKFDLEQAEFEVSLRL
jgi:hypothetical protein